MVISPLVTIMICLGLSMIIKPVEIGRVNCQENIYSIKNVDGLAGSFCLGSGYISSREYYYVFAKENDGSFHRISLKSSDSYLFQDENTKPYIFWQQITYRPSYWIHIWPRKFNWTEDSVYSIHVPTNTIIQEFKVN